MDFASRAPIATPAVAWNPRARGEEGSEDATRGEDANGNEDAAARRHATEEGDAGGTAVEKREAREADGRAPEEAPSARSRARPRARRDNCRAHEDEDDAMCVSGRGRSADACVLGGGQRTDETTTETLTDDDVAQPYWQL